MKQAGEIWKVEHSRKGAMTLRLLEDVDPESDNFFKAEIIEGRARFMSDACRVAQYDHGYGTEGTEIELRASLTSFLIETNNPRAETVLTFTAP